MTKTTLPRRQTGKIIIWLIVAVVIIGGVWYLESKKSNEEETIKIGAILPLSGVAVQQGDNVRKAIEMAVKNKEVNGKKIEIIFEDDESSNSPAKATTIIQKLIDIDKVKFIIGPMMSAEIEALNQVLNENDVIAITFGAVTSPFSRFGENMFTTSPTFASECNEMIKFMADQNFKTVAFIGVNTDAGLEIKNVLEKELTENDIDLISTELVNLGVKDFRTTLTKIKSQNPDAIYFWHIPALSGMIVKQAKELNIEVPLLTFRNIEDPTAAITAEGTLESIIYTASVESESRNEFISLFNQTYDSQPNIFSDSAFDAINLLIKAIESESLDVVKIREYLKGIQNYPGAIGILSFDENKDVKQDFIIKTVKDGQFVLYE